MKLNIKELSQGTSNTFKEILLHILSAIPMLLEELSRQEASYYDLPDWDWGMPTISDLTILATDQANATIINRK